MSPTLINVADLVNPETGNTYRQDNLALSHTIPVGALVELENGVRLHVLQQTRDCDGTPLYSLGILEEEGDLAMISPEWEDGVFRIKLLHCFNGYGEESLRRVD